MSETFYAGKRLVDAMTLSVAGREDDEATLVRLVEKVLFVEFGGRSDMEDFEDLALEAYATIPKILRSYNPTKGTRLESWGWRLMTQACMKYVERQDRMRRNEVQMTNWDETVGDWEDRAADVSWQSDVGWYCEQTGENERRMQWAAEYSLVKKLLEPIDQVILDMTLEGELQEKIAAATGLSQSRVSRRLKNIANKFRDLQPERQKSARRQA